MDATTSDRLESVLRGAISCTSDEAAQILDESPTLISVLVRHASPSPAPAIDSPSAPGGAEGGPV